MAYVYISEADQLASEAAALKAKTSVVLIKTDGVFDYYHDSSHQGVQFSRYPKGTPIDEVTSAAVYYAAYLPLWHIRTELLRPASGPRDPEKVGAATKEIMSFLMNLMESLKTV